MSRARKVFPKLALLCVALNIFSAFNLRGRKDGSSGYKCKKYKFCILCGRG